MAAGQSWRTMPGAPGSGTPVCLADELDQPVSSVVLDGFPLLLVRSADGLKAYVNACPHQFLPLDWRSGNILSADGRLLRCSNHDAGFDACSGQGLGGLVAGCALIPVPIREVDGAVLIG